MADAPQPASDGESSEPAAPPSELDEARARAERATEEAERAAAERSAAEREAASWAAEAHRLRRLLQGQQQTARRRAKMGAQDDEAAAQAEIAELQAQVQQALESREAAARRAAEFAVVERTAAQRAAVARAALTRLGAARGRTGRSAESPPPPAAHAASASPARGTPTPPVADAPREAPRRPEPEASGDLGRVARTAENAAPLRPRNEPMLRNLVSPSEAGSGVPSLRPGATSLGAQIKEEGAQGGPYAERVSSWEAQASVAAAELAAQEQARAESTLARERAQRLKATAFGARTLLDTEEESSSSRWIIAVGVTLFGVAAAAAAVWLMSGPDAAAPTTAQISTPSTPNVIRARPAEPTVPPSSEPAPPEGRKPAWLRHAVVPDQIDDRPMVAIVIDDMGMDELTTAQVIALSGPLTISFLPAAPRLTRQAEQARAAGHEVMAHVPMEPLGSSNDPGPNYLGVRFGSEELRARLSWNLNQLTGIVGMNNHMGSLFTRSSEGMRLVMEELRAREMIFLDSVTTGSSVGASIAAQEDIPYTRRDIFLDDERDAQDVMDRIYELESIARRRGSAVAIGHPLPGTIDALNKWLVEAQRRGIQVVPITTVVQFQMEQRRRSRASG